MSLVKQDTLYERIELELNNANIHYRQMRSNKLGEQRFVGTSLAVEAKAINLISLHIHNFYDIR